MPDARPPIPEVEPPRPSRNRKPWWTDPWIVGLGVLAAVLFVAVVVVVLDGGGSDDDETAAEVTSSTTSTTATTVATSSTTTTSTSTTTTTSTPSTTSTTAVEASTTSPPTTSRPGQVPSATEHAQAMARWENYLTDAPEGIYNMDYRTGLGFHVCLLVFGDDPTEAFYADDCNRPGYDGTCAQCGPRTVDSLFGTILQFIDAGIPTDVEYHPDHGYPTLIRALDAPPDDPDRGFEIVMGEVGLGSGD